MSLKITNFTLPGANELRAGSHLMFLKKFVVQRPRGIDYQFVYVAAMANSLVTLMLIHHSTTLHLIGETVIAYWNANTFQAQFIISNPCAEFILGKFKNIFVMLEFILGKHNYIFAFHIIWHE